MTARRPQRITYTFRALESDLPTLVAAGWIVRARTFPPSLSEASVLLVWGGVGEPPGVGTAEGAE